MYLGHITNGSTEAQGPSYLHYHGDIITALNHLNSYHGYSGSTCMPRYVSGSHWGTLTNGLQAYWKLVESSGTRADSHTGYTLSPVGTVGNTWGQLYRYSGDFTHDNHLKTVALGWIERSVTIAAWCFIRDVTYPFMGLVTKDDATSDRQWTLSYNNYKFEFSINGSAATVVQSTTVAVGKWHFVLAGYNASGQTTNIRVGTPIDSDTLGSAVTKSTGMTMNSGESPIYISGYSNNSSPWWGRVGPVAIWTRSLFAPEQESAWNGGDGSTYPMVG